MVKEKSPKSQTGSGGTGTGNKDEWNGVDTPGKFLNPDVIFRPKYDLTVRFCVKFNLFTLHSDCIEPICQRHNRRRKRTIRERSHITKFSLIFFIFTYQFAYSVNIVSMAMY